MQPMVNMQGEDLRTVFIEQAELLTANVITPNDSEDAIAQILGIIGDDRSVMAWDFDHIPVTGLKEALESANIATTDPHDGTVRVGITGIDAAFAATGSIVVSAQPGRDRTTSLLPHTHIAILREDQILPHFDAWIETVKADKDAFRKSGNHIVITGASRTADIAMELVLGAHGPANLHLIIL